MGDSQQSGSQRKTELAVGATVPEVPRKTSLWGTVVALVEAVRPTNWVKNLFVLAALGFTPEKWDATRIGQAALAFATFCLASGSIYIWNDWCDRERDRQHPHKKLRPIASGRLNPHLALTSSVVLVGVALACAAILGTPFLLVIAGYIVLQLLYSLYLKHMVILDVMALATGFLLRVLGGGAAVNIQVSSWLLVTTSMLALFLGFTKRRQELRQLQENSANHRTVLEEYNVEFIDQMNAVLAGACIVCYALYTVAPETTSKFHTHALIATLPFVMYGLLRYLNLIHVRDLGDNPTEVVLRDRPLQVCIVLWLATFLLILKFKP